MKVLITGINGFSGSHLADYILNNHSEVVIYGLVREHGSTENLQHISSDRLVLRQGDLLDYGSLLWAVTEAKPDIIFHLAAQINIKSSFATPADAFKTNIIGTLNLLEAVRFSGLSLIIHLCSSSEVYGRVKENEIPIKEECPLRPASPYAISKVAADMLGYQYWLSYGMKIIRSRAFTLIGTRQSETCVLPSFCKQIALIEKGKQEPVIKVGNLDSVRTFCDVRDIARAYWLLATNCQSGEVYNIGSKRTLAIGEMLNALLVLSPMRNEIKIEKDLSLFRPSDVTLQIPDCAKFRKATGWKPEIPLEQTLKDTLNYWRNKE